MTNLNGTGYKVTNHLAGSGSNVFLRLHLPNLLVETVPGLPNVNFKSFVEQDLRFSGTKKIT